jgi:hypothetical protein
MNRRAAEWAALGRKGLGQRQIHPWGVVLRYHRRNGVETELNRLMALEGDCCAFLEFTLVEDGAELVLTVTGPEAALPLIRECWGAQTSEHTPSPPAAVEASSFEYSMERRA